MDSGDVPGARERHEPQQPNWIVHGEEFGRGLRAGYLVTGAGVFLSLVSFWWFGLNADDLVGMVAERVIHALCFFAMTGLLAYALGCWAFCGGPGSAWGRGVVTGLIRFWKYPALAGFVLLVFGLISAPILRRQNQMQFEEEQRALARRIEDEKLAAGARRRAGERHAQELIEQQRREQAARDAAESEARAEWTRARAAARNAQWRREREADERREAQPAPAPPDMRSPSRERGTTAPDTRGADSGVAPKAEPGMHIKEPAAPAPLHQDATGRVWPTGAVEVFVLRDGGGEIFARSVIETDDGYAIKQPDGRIVHVLGGTVDGRIKR